MDEADSRDESRRRSRNQNEKNRRDQFNVLLAELNSMVSAESAESPALSADSGRRVDKTTVLLATIAFLRRRQAEQRVSAASAACRPDAEAAKWRPAFMAEAEFVHLMLEAGDGFVLAVDADNDTIIYASESIAWLLGYTPASLVESKSTRADVMDASEAAVLRQAVDNALKLDSHASINMSVHMKRSSSDPHNADADDYELVNVSGYVTRWTATNDSSAHHNPGLTDDEEDDEADEEPGVVANGRSRDATRPVFVCAARLAVPQLVHELPGFASGSQLEFVSRYSLEWKFVFLDPRGPAIVGYLPFEVLGTSGYEYYHPDDLDRIVRCHESLMQTGEVSSCRHRFLTKGQQWIWLQTRYYITYHQWNSKPEFIVATHNVVPFDGVSDSDVRLGADSAQTDAVRAGSPTWSSRSSVCGSSGTGVASRHSLSSCRLSGYSENVANLDGIVSTYANAAMSATPVIGAGHNVPGSRDMLDTRPGNASYPEPADYQVVATDMDSFVSDAFFEPSFGFEPASALAAAPAMDVTGQTLRLDQPAQQLQADFQNQLRQKHAELSKRIVEQQEELRRISEQLLISQCAILPVQPSLPSQPVEMPANPRQVVDDDEDSEVRFLVDTGQKFVKYC